MANIITARRSGFVRRGGSQRRQTLWFGGVSVQSTLAGASTAILQTSLNAAALALRPFTVVRNHGFVFLESDQVVADCHRGGQNLIYEQL